nr:hypothetical protein [Endozoicomonas sp.]
NALLFNKKSGSKELFFIEIEKLSSFMTWRRAARNNIGQDYSLIKVCSGPGNEKLHFMLNNSTASYSQS